MKIASFQIVTAFEPDRSVLLSLGPALKSMEQRTGAKLFQVNAPEDAPPSLPRMVVRMKDGTNLNVCQDRFDLTFTPPSHVAEDLGEAEGYLRRMFSSVLNPLLDVVSSYDWVGVVINLEYDEDPRKSSSSTEAVYSLFRKITNVSLEKDALRSFRLQFGYEENGFFNTIAIEGFEEREGHMQIKPNHMGVVKIDPSEFPLKSCGVSISHDVNNKPGDKTDVGSDFKKIVDRQIEAIRELPSRFNLREVLP